MGQWAHCAMHTGNGDLGQPEQVGAAVRAWASGWAAVSADMCSHCWLWSLESVRSVKWLNLKTVECSRLLNGPTDSERTHAPKWVVCLTVPCA